MPGFTLWTKVTTHGLSTSDSNLEKWNGFVRARYIFGLIPVSTEPIIFNQVCNI